MTYFDRIVKKYAMYTQIQINQSQHAFLTKCSFNEYMMKVCAECPYDLE